MPRKAIKKPGASLPSGLRAPIQIESLGLWPGSLTRDEIIKQLSEQGGEKLNALMKYYNIPLHSPEKWKHLSWCHAEELGLMEVTLKLILEQRTVNSVHYATEFLEDELKLRERLEPMIDRKIKHLIQLKAQKQMLRQISAAREGEQPKRIAASNR